MRVTRAMPCLPASLDAEVEALWQAAAARVAAGGAGQLFNGRVFSADSIAPHAITGHLTEFRRIVAQMERPGLFAALGVRPLAVCGVLRCADGVVFGRRHAAAIYQPGMWQLPPAGSVDAEAVAADGSVDVFAQLRAELVEELGLSPAAVRDPRPLCVVEHPGSHVCDLGIGLTTALAGADVLAIQAEHGNREYQRFAAVGFGALAGFVAQAGETLVPPAREFLCQMGLLSGDVA